MALHNGNAHFHEEENSVLSFGNMLHSNRLASFLANRWPDQQSSSFIHLCTAQKLAQAGLEYFAVGEARCVVCYILVKNLEPTSDPWFCHAAAKPDCLLIKLGKPSRPDQYTLQQFVDLISERRKQYIKNQCQVMKEKILDNFLSLYKEENGIGHGIDF